MANVQTANRALDEAVRTAHEQDRERASALLDLFVELPPKGPAIRAIVRVLEQAREDGARWPELAKEMAFRRALTDPGLTERELERIR